MGFTRILIIYYIFQFFSSAVTKDGISCFSDSKSDYIKKDWGKVVDLIFKRDTSPIDSSQIIYYSTTCNNYKQIASFQSEKVFTLMDSFNERGVLQVKEDNVIYTIRNTMGSDSGVYVLRQNMIHVQIQLDIPDKLLNPDENNDEKSSSDPKWLSGLLGGLLVLTVVISLAVALWFWKKHSDSKRKRRSHTDVKYTAYGSKASAIDSKTVGFLADRENLKRRNVITEEASKNMEFRNQQRIPKTEAVKTDIFQSLQVARGPKYPIEPAFMSLPVVKPEIRAKSNIDIHYEKSRKHEQNNSKNN